jgi:hypothetical protein
MSLYVLSKHERALLRAKEVADFKREEAEKKKELEELFGPFRPQVAVLILSQEMILNKTVVLPSRPSDPSSVLLIPVGGIPQVYGKDYIVSGTNLEWNQLGLDNFLEPDDILILHY